MKEDAFRAWLDASYTKETAQSRLAGARRVEGVHGDLDRHYESDLMRNVEDRLTYSRDDETSLRPNESGIRIDGDLRTGLASLKQAVRCYGRFRSQLCAGPTQKSSEPASPRYYAVHIVPLSETDGGGFAAVVPELPGCRSDGDTPQEALDNAYDAIGCWIEAAEEMGRAVPPPRRLAA